MKKVAIGFVVLLLMLPLAFAGSDKVVEIPNGGYFSLGKDENTILQFKNFTDRKITLTSIEKNAVTLQNPEYVRASFFKENGQLNIKKDAVYLSLGEEARSYETIEMLCIIRLEKIENSKAFFKITYYSVPPAPEIPPGQKITVQIAK